MKTFTIGLAMSLGIMSGAAQAQQMLTINGTEYLVSDLMVRCQSIANDPQGQIACFSNVAQLLEQQGSQEEQPATMSVTQALDALRSAAEYRHEDTGLKISGSDCFIQVIYFNNYFHISRRNISTIDLFSAKFDASNIEMDQIVRNQGGQAPLAKGTLKTGAIAVMQGGAALESTQNNFASRSPGTSLEVYADEVAAQLPARESQTVEFVLVHPQNSDSSDEIWTAFEGFVNACKT